MNLMHGVWCPPVVCVPAAPPGQPAAPVFRWRDDAGVWHAGAELPVAIQQRLPGPEWARCEAHRFRRLGDRRAA
jgi:hypothetical protein